MRIPFFFFLVALLYSTMAFAQYVGIGVSNPTLGRLQVNGAVGRTTAIFGGDGIGISLQRNLPGIGYNQYDNTTPLVLGLGLSLLQSVSTANGSMYFDFYNTNAGANTAPQYNYGKMTIRSNGNVTLNGTEANASLFVKPYPAPLKSATAYLRGTTHKSEFMAYESQNTSINGGINFADVYINDQATLGNVYMGNGTSKIGINRADPLASLDIGQVNNRGLILVNPNNFNNWEFAVTKNLTLPGSDLYLYYNQAYRGNFFHVDGDYYQLSDERFKTGVAPLPAVLHKLMQLRPVEYDFIMSPSGIKNMGFIAQEVAKLFPELITTVQDSSVGYEGIADLQMLQYDGFGPIAIKAIQEQQEAIKKIQEQNAALKKRMEGVKKNLETLTISNQSYEKK